MTDGRTCWTNVEEQSDGEASRSVDVVEWRLELLAYKKNNKNNKKKIFIWLKNINHS